ncbi:hypothetical protein EDC94DRAFT_581265 [Helicostylum pulchrum]|nr:hypothetical protein EDC94DRAFT_581265 [Helicostylum pulchrum]
MFLKNENYWLCFLKYFWKHENHDPNAISDIVDSRVSEDIRSWIEEHVEKHMSWKTFKALLRLNPEDLAHLENIASEKSGAAVPFNLSVYYKMDTTFRTKNLIESYYNRFKTYNFGRSRNLRVDICYIGFPRS